MRADLHTTDPVDAATWEANHAPDMREDPPSERDLLAESGDRDPGPFADAYRESVATVRAIRGDAA